MEDEEIKFPFDVENFQKAVNKMEQSMSTIGSKMVSFGKTMKDSVSAGIMNATAKIGLLVKGFKSIMNNIPEIGKGFKLASEIMSREFFYPIRQLILPYLQKMLDWVRDHRTLFAKWGTAVADNLKIVINVVKTLWQSLKDVVEILTNSLQKGLGTSFKTLEEFMRVLQVKIAFMTLFIGDAIKALVEKIQPTFSYIIETGAKVLGFFGDLLSSWMKLNDHGHSLWTVLDKIYVIFDKIIRFIGNAIAGFFEGLLEPLKHIMTPLQHIVDCFDRLLDALGLNDSSGVRGAFKSIGSILGGGLLTAFYALATVLDTIVSAVMTIGQLAGAIKDIFTANWDSLKGRGSEIADLWKQYGERQKHQWADEWYKDLFEKGDELNTQKQTSGGGAGRSFEVNDALITKRGEVINLNPADNVYAFKGIPNMGSNISAPVTVTINVTATEGNAQTIGQQIGTGLSKSFVDRLKEQQMLGGW